MNDFKGQSIDAVLRELLKQGRIDPAGAEKLASQGIDRLRTFLSGDTAATPTTTSPTATVQDGPLPVQVPAGEDAQDGAGDEPDAFLEHTVPLRGGRFAHVVVPEHFTRADADRVAGVLAALALDDADEGASS